MQEKKKTTEELMETILQSRKNIKQLIVELEPEQLNMTLQDYLTQYLAKTNLSAADVIRESGLNDSYGHQIFNGIRKNISRNKLLMLALGMQLTPEETQKMLKIANRGALYPRVKLDLIVIFALKKKWSVIETNNFLQDLGMPPLE